MGSQGQVPECRSHLWPGDVHCCIPLRSRKGGRWGHGNASPNHDGCAFQRCISVHGLALDSTIVVDRDSVGDEADPVVKGKIQSAQLMTVVSWCTYPVVYLFPMLGINAAHAVVAIQIGYCASDIISKCGVGLLIYQITYAKSSKECLLP